MHAACSLYAAVSTGRGGWLMQTDYTQNPRSRVNERRFYANNHMIFGWPIRSGRNRVERIGFVEGDYGTATGGTSPG
jgi:hypothetical protein